MKIFTEQNLSNFEFWSGATQFAKVFTDEQLDDIECYLSDLYPDGIDETTLNDLFWFEPDTIAEWLGFDNFEQLEKFNYGEEDEEDEEEDEEDEEEDEEEEKNN